MYKRHHDLLLGHEGPRFFFVQALVDNAELSEGEIKELIQCMPPNQQVFLRKRFG